MDGVDGAKGGLDDMGGTDGDEGVEGGVNGMGGVDSADGVEGGVAGIDDVSGVVGPGGVEGGVDGVDGAEDEGVLCHSTVIVPSASLNVLHGGRCKKMQYSVPDIISRVFFL